MLIDNTYLANNAFRGLVIDKIYEKETDLPTSDDNTALGRYVLVIGESNDNKVYQRVWRKDGRLYEFITSLSPLSEAEEADLKTRQDARIDEFFKDGDSNSAGQKAIDNFNDRLSASEDRLKEIETYGVYSISEIDSKIEELNEAINNNILKWQTH